MTQQQQQQRQPLSDLFTTPLETISITPTRQQQQQLMRNLKEKDRELYDKFKELRLFMIHHEDNYANVVRDISILYNQLFLCLFHNMEFIDSRLIRKILEYLYKFLYIEHFGNPTRPETALLDLIKLDQVDSYNFFNPYSNVDNDQRYSSECVSPDQLWTIMFSPYDTSSCITYIDKQDVIHYYLTLADLLANLYPIYPVKCSMCMVFLFKTHSLPRSTIIGCLSTVVIHLDRIKQVRGIQKELSILGHIIDSHSLRCDDSDVREREFVDIVSYLLNIWSKTSLTDSDLIRKLFTIKQISYANHVQQYALNKTTMKSLREDIDMNLVTKIYESIPFEITEQTQSKALTKSLLNPTAKSFVPR